MGDDQNWRLTAAPGEGEARRSIEHVLARVRVQDGGRSDPELPRDVVVTHDGKTLFAYATSEASIRAARTALQLHAPQSSIVISHWDEQLDEWLQVDPPLSAEERQRKEAFERDAEKVESRTLITSAGKLIRGEVEASMGRWAQELGLRLTIHEHRHLLTYQVLFEVTGPKRKIDQFAAGLNAEEHATMRAERMVMLSPL